MCYSSSGNYKSKLQWDISSHLSECLKLTTQEAIVGEDVEKVEPLTLLVGMQTGVATVENNKMSFLKKQKIELPYDPESALLGIYPKDIKILI